MTRPDTISPPPEVSEEARRLVEDFGAVCIHVNHSLGYNTATLAPTRDALLHYIAGIEEDRARLDVIEREAGRRISVRDERDATICNIYLEGVAGDPIGYGVLGSLRDAADCILRETRHPAAIDTAQEKPE